MQGSSAGPIIRQNAPPTFDAVVGSGERSDYSTLQAADDALGTGPYTLWVKQATYAAGLVVASNDVYIFVEPGTTISAAITLSGDNITLVLGAGCDIDGILTMSGANVSVICQNGVDLDRTILSGNNGFLDGGGWDTIALTTTDEAIQVTANDCIVQNIAAHTATGGSASDAVEVASAGPLRNTVKNVKVIDSDSRGIHFRGNDGLLQGCLILGADTQGIRVDGTLNQIIGNQMRDTANDGIQVTASGDGTVIIGNIIQDHGAQGIDLHGDAENCVVDGNKVDDLGTSNGIVDNSGTSTVGDNDETAF
jgi:hypothetical protein